MIRGSRRLALLAAAALGMLGVSSVALAGDTRSAAAPPKPVVESAPVLPVTAKDKDGKVVVVKDASRIVPLNGDIAEVIFALGLTRNIVGVDTSATYPAKAVAGLPKIGYQRTLSAEGILSLRPTLVVGSALAGPQTVIDQLRTAGVTVLLIPDFRGLDAGSRKLRTLGKALGVPKRGERLAKQVDRQITIAKREIASVATRPKVAFLYLRGTQVQMIGGNDSGADALIAAAGGRDMGTALGIESFKTLTPESLVAGQPDVILVLSAGLQSVGGVDGLLRIPGVAQTPAGKNRRIIHYDDQLLLGLGPRTGMALRQLIRGLHPDVR